VEHFLRQFYGANEARIVPGKVLDALYMRDWPGNIRQLQNALQRYVTLKRLDFDDDLHESQSEMEEHTSLPEGLGLQTALEQFERHYIGKCLTQNNGHKGKTAEMLEIDAKTLYRRMKKYRIEV
jgi:DNA-binding NtrC family response regulator